MKEVDESVATKLNDLHQKQSSRANQGRTALGDLPIGTKVWYLRPEKAGNKLDTKWIGPGLIVAREGERSYVVEIKPGHQVKAPRHSLKEYTVDSFGGSPLPLFFHKRTEVDPDAAPDEWITEEIQAHRKNNQGNWEFKTKWKGSDVVTWEQVGNFFPRYNSDLVKYCQTKKIPLDLTKYLSPTPRV